MTTKILNNLNNFSATNNQNGIPNIFFLAGRSVCQEIFIDGIQAQHFVGL
jgi:hypothetical protein